MSKKDLFRSPFDDGTISKLEIFEDYFKEWLPVFISKEIPIWKEIRIFDFFGGEGKDVNGVYGSPMRILKVLNQNNSLILKSKVKIHVVINEFEKEKFQVLKENLELIADNSLYTLKYYNEDFIFIFNRYYEKMRLTPNFLFLDQSGIKQITQTVFSRLIELKQTDFLFFISSSFIKRFADVEEFRKYLSFTKQHFEGESYYHIHRIVLNYYRSLIPIEKSYFIAPFSIKKPAGIYGLIFGSNHTYGMEKFLSVCWKHDSLTGEANFDIDNEKIDSLKPTLFHEMNIPSKRQLFEENLRNQIFDGNLKTNLQVYLFTLNEGFLFKDTNLILKQLKQQNKIEFEFNLISSRLHKELESEIKLK